MKNKVEREIPAEFLETRKGFESTEIGNPEIQRTAPQVRVSTGDDKVVDSIEDIVKKLVKDGMTISFHHHLREGDFIFNKVMDAIISLGIKDLTLAPS